MKKWMCAAFLTLLFLLSGCGKEEAVEPTKISTAPVESLSLVVTEDSIGELEQYSDLRQLDLTGSRCYGAIEDYKARHPEVEVTYTVTLGDQQVPTDAELLDLEPEDTDFDRLLEDLQYLPKLRQVTLEGTALTKEELSQLRDTYEETAFRCNFTILGETYPEDTRELDLSGLTGEEAQEAAQTLSRLPMLETVELMDGEDHSELTLEDVAALQKAAPEVKFHYSFDLFGKRVSTLDERIEFKNKRLGDSREEELRQALDVLKDCKYMLLESCRFSDEVLAQLREDYRGQTKIVWRIFFAKAGSCLTDRTVLRYVYNVFNSTVKKLQYCEDVEYIDFGHNEALSDWSWVANMPNLKAIIVSGSIIKDLTPFENCKKLEFLELSNCGLLTDISPLAQCESLKRLNISYTKVEDLSPLDHLPLECFVYVKPKASQEELDRFGELHPDCVTSYENNEYGYPWRYEQDGSFTPAYQELKEVFGYPDAKDTLW